MAVDPKLNNAAVLAQRAYNNAVASLAASQQAIATITAKGGTPTAAQTAALTAAQNAVTTSSTTVKSAQMALNAATNNVAVAAGTTGKAVSPAVDSGVKQATPYNVQTTTGTGPTMSSSNGLLEIAGATALAMAAANPAGTAKLVGSLFSSAKDILGVGGTTSSTTATPTAATTGAGTAATATQYGAFGEPPTGNAPVITTSDPSQFPAYDDEGNLAPGFAINEENGGTYYKGFDSISTPATLPLTAAEQAMLDANDPPGYSQTSVPLTAAEQAMLDANDPPGRNNDLVDTSSDPNTNVGADTPRAERMGVVDAATDPNTNVGADTPRERPETGSLSLDDPYYGLSPAQLQDLGGADPTDPYIRARLGIPQLPGSELAATPGFGTVKTGIPIVDTALSTLGSLFNFGGKTTKPSVTQSGTTTGEPVPTPDTAAVAQDAAKLRAQDPALTDDEDQNLQNVVGAQGEIVRAEDNIQNNNRSILANEEAQAAAQENQRQAQAIIDQNNAELADDNLPDDRRAELEANNAAQRASIAENAAVIDEAQTNIDNATANNERQADSIITNQGVIAQNSDAFTANSENLGAPVVADNDPATTPAVDQNFIDANASPQDVDPGDDLALEEPVEDTFVEADITITELSEEETNALFDGADPNLVDSFVEADTTVTELTEAETEALFESGDPAAVDQNFIDANTAPENFDPQAVDQNLLDANAAPQSFDPQAVDQNFVDANADPQNSIVDQNLIDANAEPQHFDPEAVDEFAGVDEQIRANENALEEPPLLSPEEVDAELAAAAAEGAEQYEATDVDAKDDEGLPQDDGTTDGIQDQINDQDAAEQAAAKDNALKQATLQARYKQPASSDWRVRLQLAPGANYLYKAGKDGGEAGILKPLYDTDGVIFPYTPSIETSYNANYEMYDLTHSNFRGYFYKNSRVNDINIRATFTAQDTQEAAYLLAVIHFFRSVTKMFYGAKDAYRGAPPPLTYLSGLGAYQFNQHPCVVSQFNYSLPPDVDYIRANAPNNYGTNLLTQRARTGAIATNAGSASLTRLMGTLTKPPVGATATPPTPGMMNQNVNNTSQATYVPTKIELSITLLPINTRSQVSTQFNMKDFASGALIKGGFW
jgi:hypothetical protein